MKKLYKILLYNLIVLLSFISCEMEQGGSIISPQNGLDKDFYLKQIKFSAGTLRYDFKPGDFINYLRVPADTTTVSVTPVARSLWSSVYVNDVLLEEGVESADVAVTAGAENIIKIRVVAENGRELLYRIYVSFISSDFSNAKLSSLDIGVPLAPQFSSDVFTYSATVTTASISLKAVPANTAAVFEVSVNDAVVTNLNSISLNTGSNTIVVTATAEDDQTTETYTVNITRQSAASDDSSLASLSIDGGALTPSFDQAVLTYAAVVASTSNPINLHVAANSSAAKYVVKLGGTTVADLTKITLSESGSNAITITVTAGNNTTTTYTIDATVTTGPVTVVDASLQSLSVIMGTKSKRPLYPGNVTTGPNPNKTKFSSTTYQYVTVIYGFSTMTLTAVATDPGVKNIQFTADGTSVSNATFAGGTGTAAITLSAGLVTQVDVVVTASDGTTVKKYTVFAKLLNVDEFFWGIYTQTMDLSLANNFPPNQHPAPGSSHRYDDLVVPSNGGYMNWTVVSNSGNVTSEMNFVNYNDGKNGVNYNDGGIVLNGIQQFLCTESNQSGTQTTKPNTTFSISTPEGETVAILSYHLTIKDAMPVTGADSYTGIKNYLGSTTDLNQMYFGGGSGTPYPFAGTYKWKESWVPPAGTHK